MHRDRGWTDVVRGPMLEEVGDARLKSALGDVSMTYSTDTKLQDLEVHGNSKDVLAGTWWMWRSIETDHGRAERSRR